MALDTSIITRGMNRVELEPRSNALARMLKLQGAQQEQEMNAQKMDEYRRGLASQNQLRTALGVEGADPYKVLLQSGDVKGASEYAKSQAEVEKTRATTKETGMKSANMALTQLRAMLNNVNDPQAAKQWLVAAYQDPDTKGIFERMGPMDEALRRFDQSVVDPATFQRWKQGASMNSDDLVKLTTPDANAVLSSQTSRRGQDLSAQTARRGQDLVNARAKDSTAATMSKPFEITGEDGKPVLVQQDKQGNIRPVQGYQPKQGASKPLNEGQSKALLFGSRMQEANSIFDELEAAGKTKSVPGSNAPFIGGAVTALSGEKNQKLEQAKRDFINATLRRESGAAIAASEFDNAEKQYFPQIGDSPAVITQKKRNREVATRGILAEVPDSENRVSKVRGAKPASNIDALLDKYK